MFATEPAVVCGRCLCWVASFGVGEEQKPPETPKKSAGPVPWSRPELCRDNPVDKKTHTHPAPWSNDYGMR